MKCEARAPTEMSRQPDRRRDAFWRALSSVLVDSWMIWSGSAEARVRMHVSAGRSTLYELMRSQPVIFDSTSFSHTRLHPFRGSLFFNSVRPYRRTSTLRHTRSESPTLTRNKTKKNRVQVVAEVHAHRLELKVDILCAFRRPNTNRTLPACTLQITRKPLRGILP